MNFIELPARTDACWRSLEWRKVKLDECIRLHDLKIEALSELTGASPATVVIWLRNHQSRSVIGVNTLRLLILELNQRVRVA